MGGPNNIGQSALWHEYILFRVRGFEGNYSSRGVCWVPPYGSSGFCSSFAAWFHPLSQSFRRVEQVSDFVPWAISLVSG